MIHYEGNVYRPPSEAYSLLIQATIGCSYNQCSFCALYKGESFRIRTEEEIEADLLYARAHYPRVEKIFLCDGDALCLSMERLTRILTRCRSLFPECRSVNVYGNARDVLAKGPENLKRLRDSGVRIIYIGAESGSDKVLSMVHKGSTAEDMKKAICMIEDCGIKASVTLISGLGGKALSEQHAIDSASLISRTAPSYFSFLTLVLTPQMDLYQEAQKGLFQPLTTGDVLKETELFFRHIDLPDTMVSTVDVGVTRPVQCMFRSNHVSNALVLRGTFPADKDALISQVQSARKYF